jgi:hypothetical protein
MRVTLVNRERGSHSNQRLTAIRRSKSYRLDVVSDVTRAEWVDIDDLLYSDSESDRVIRSIVNPDTILLTTALRDGLTPSVPFIARLIEARAHAAIDTPLFVIACENRLDSTWIRDEVARQTGLAFSRIGPSANIHFLPCISDRICSMPEYDQHADCAYVPVEPYAKWTIERAGPIRQLEEALNHVVNGQRRVEFVDDIMPYRRQKLWLVNGPHLALALLARARGESAINLFLRSPLNEILFRAVQRELAIAVRFATSDLGDMESFNQRIFERFRDYPDVVDRVASRLRRNRLEEFVTDLDAKLGEPVRLILERTHGDVAQVPVTVRIVFQCLDIIAKGRYLD